MSLNVIQQVKFLVTGMFCVLLVGCVAKGPSFKEPSSPPKGQSMLYIYRPWVMTGCGVTYPIVLNDEKMPVPLNGNGYLSFVTQPGEQKIYVDSPDIDNVLEFDAEPNKTYYIKISTRNYVMVHVHVPLLINENLALLELEKCKLSVWKPHYIKEDNDD